VAILGSRNMWNDISKLVDYGFSKKQQLQIAGPEDNKTKTTDDFPSLTSALVVLSDNKKTEKL
jgi:hypothetical protein